MCLRVNRLKRFTLNPSQGLVCLESIPQDNQLKPTPPEPLNTPVETTEQEMTQ